MSAARILIPVVALLIGGWLVFDGTRALTVGDYLTARSGPRAGQLGPWSQFVAKIGLNPRSTTVKVAHLTLGLLWVLGVVIFLVRPSTGWWLLMATSVGTLWYLPLGTAFALIELALLLTPAIRALR